MAAKSLRERVRDAIPGYRTAQNRHKRLQNDMIALPDVGLADLDADYQNRIWQAIDNGAENLHDLRASYIADRQKLMAQGEFHVLVVNSSRQAYYAAETAESAGADHALDFLRAELDTLMADVNDHRAILAAHPTTAEAAMNAGADGLDRWKRAEDLIRRYDELRTEHQRYVRLQSGNQPADFAVIGQFAGFLEAEPYWRYCRSIRSAEHSTDPAIAKWLSTQPGDAEYHRKSTWPATMSRADWLLVVADNDPWLPDAAHIDRLAQRAEQLFAKGRSYRSGIEINGFRANMADLKALGANIDFVLEPTDGQRAATVQEIPWKFRSEKRSNL